MSGRRLLVGCARAAILVGLAAARPAAAHDVDVTSVARVFLDQLGERSYSISVVDTQVPPIRNAAAVLPEDCFPRTPESSGPVPLIGFTFDCDRPLTFDDVLTLPWDLSGVVVLARWMDGTEASGFFRGDGLTVLVALDALRAGSGSFGHLAGTYTRLGLEHILLGVDHLLFILGLLILIQGAWPLVKTVTAFTIAHSLTLAAAVLGIVPVDSGPVEAAIALSIVLLAREVVMGFRGQESLVHRKPWIVAFVFGLLHGLGFAGALGEIGLRGGDIPLALLFFNVGVELGQLAFVSALVTIQVASAGRIRKLIPRLQPAVGYALGALATLWFFERLPAVWGGG